ncbi:unnamed protein product [Clonostachys rosea f. rosea IK726]|nr:unnamed protein product [Clonostachys rosea f. rosea IK726]
MIRLIRASLQKPSTKYSHLERLNQLSVTYLYRYRLTGAEVDRKTSDSIAQNALSMALEGKLDHLKLQAAVENIERVIEGSQLTKPRFDLELGKLYIIKYDRLGCPTDLETGHSLLQRGLRKATSSSVRRELLIVLGGMVHLRRFAADGSSADIEAAIEMFEEALQISSEADRSGVMLLLGLGSAYLSRYSRTKSPQDFNTGMTTLENAHKAALEADLLVDDALSHLADAHSLLYQKGKDLPSINRAIELAEEAFVIGIESIDKWNRLECLSQYYLFRYEQTNDQSDLQAALRRLREVVEQIPGDHPDRAWYFQRYTAFLTVFGGNEIGHTETDSLTLLEEALDHGPSRPVQRIWAGRRLAKQYTVEGAWKLAYRALERTMALVPLLTPNFLRNDDKKSVISPIAGLATDAAVVALRAGKSPYEAVNLIELGRGIIQSSLTSMRTDVSKLEEAHPKLAQTFVRSRDLLDTPWLPPEPPSHADSRPLAPGADSRPLAPGQHPNVRYAAHRELQRTIQEIRNLDGFERFGLGPTESEIKAAAASGPIVMINVSASGKAFIMEPENIQMLWLPLLSEKAMHEYEVKMRSGQIHTTLEWLWRVIVKPVLRVLGYDDGPADTWPRICWIPTGELIKFPLHAAGLHLQGESQSLLDRAVSTYSSSLRTVVDARRNGQNSEPSRSTATAALVGVETTLAAVRSEMDGVSRICTSMGMQVLRPEPFQGDVMAALNSCDVFHFAGHGKTDRDDPLRSGLILADGCLTLDTLFQANLSSRKPYLAFLSACGTGQVTHHDLVHEGLHLIAACQVAGFRIVIGTLWKVRDSVCLDLALRLYEWISANGLSAESVAEGFHNICRSLRAEWVTKEQRYRESRSNKHRSSERPFSSDVEDDDEDVDDMGEERNKT